MSDCRPALPSELADLLDAESGAQVAGLVLLLLQLLLRHLLALVGQLPAHPLSHSGQWLHHVDVLDALHLASAALVRLTRYAHVPSNFIDGVSASGLSVILCSLLHYARAHDIGLEYILIAVAVDHVLHVLVESARALVVHTLHSSRQQLLRWVLVLPGGLEVVAPNSVYVLDQH